MYNFTNIQDPININMFKFSDTINNNEFELYKNNFDQLLNQAKDFYAVFDLLEIKSFNINFFLKQMTYMYSKNNIVKQYLKGSVIVVNKKYESLIKMSLSLKKPITPNYVTSNLEEGVRFLILLD
jgi:hypothetical protein